jgi:membrane-associated phospholipid phosphatase
MIYGAMFDAANAIDGAYEPFLVSLPNQQGANPIAAATAAAHRVASSLYSDAENILAWDATYNETLKSIPENEARTKGIELGKTVADAILANRLNDGSSITKHLQYGTSAGQWHPSAPIFEAVLPQWPEVTPFVSPTTMLQVAPPPTLTSRAYAQAVDEVMRIGSDSSTTRTADQTEIAKFWADGSGTASPPGHWNQIASDVLATKQLSLIEELRTMALVNFALADAGIASWKAKYDYELWRPIDAIQNGDVDSNPATQADLTWKPLIVTPPFPSYVSGHSTFSSAASAVLTSLFGPALSFTSQSDSARGWLPISTSETSPKVRAFTSFSQAADEAGMSRIYGGIHFNFDNTQGAELGTDIGNYVTNNALRKR